MGSAAIRSAISKIVFGARLVPPPAPKPAFDDYAFSEWAFEHGEVHDVSDSRVAVLAWEYADYVDSQFRSPTLSDSEFDGALFTKWMGDCGRTVAIEPESLADCVVWFCLVVQRCAPPESMQLGRLLGEHGWHRHRAAARARGDRIERPHVYSLRASTARKAA